MLSANLSPHNIRGDLAHEPNRRNKRGCSRLMLMTALLICCSLLRYASLTKLVCGENLTRPEPCDETKNGGSRANTRLPWYTSGFE